jgi:hypothetical protein
MSVAELHAEKALLETRNDAMENRVRALQSALAASALALPGSAIEMVPADLPARLGDNPTADGFGQAAGGGDDTNAMLMEAHRRSVQNARLKGAYDKADQQHQKASITLRSPGEVVSGVKDSDDYWRGVDHIDEKTTTKINFASWKFVVIPQILCLGPLIFTEHLALSSAGWMPGAVPVVIASLAVVLKIAFMCYMRKNGILYKELLQGILEPGRAHSSSCSYMPPTCLLPHASSCFFLFLPHASSGA